MSGVETNAGMLNQSTSSESKNLRTLAAESEYAKFCAKYRLVPQNEHELNVPRTLVTTTAVPFEFKRQSMPFWYVTADESGRAKSPQRVYTDVLNDLKGVAEIYMPGPDTPVCTSLHFPSLLTDEILRGLKQAGIDALVVVVPGPTDSACAWARGILGRHGVLHLMPTMLPEGLDGRLQANPDLPLILVQADPGLEKINSMGLVNPNDKNGRLGLFSNRAFALYDKGVLADLVIAETPSAEKCTAVKGPALLAHAQQLHFNQAPTPVAGL